MTPLFFPRFIAFLSLFVSSVGAGTLTIQPLKLPGKTYELCEFKLELDSKGLNPFRQTELAVNAEFTLPSGKTMMVPAFYSQDYTNVSHKGVTVPGSAGWRLRFSGKEAGIYHFKVRVTEKGKTTSIKAGPDFKLEKSASHGMIHIAKNAPRYLEYDDGQSYFGIGQNVCFTTDVAKTIDNSTMVSPILEWDDAYAQWFGKMGKNGANWARVWMKPNFYLEEGKPWDWSLEKAWRFDEVLETARKNGIYLCMCMNPERNEGGWSLTSFGNSAYGALLASLKLTYKEFTTDASCKEMYHDKLRYVVARWGYSPHIAFWEFWNEIECLENGGKEQWSREMTAYMRSLDPWGHLIKSSSHRDTPDFWGADCGDLNDMHPYFGWAGWDKTKNLGSFLPAFSQKVYDTGRPFIIGETGIARECMNGNMTAGSLADMDTNGWHIQESLWGGLFSGAVGSGMPWWWDENMDKPNVYWRFQSIANFVKDVRFNQENFTRGNDASTTDKLQLFQLKGKETQLLWVRHPDLSWYGMAVEKKSLTPIHHAKVSLEKMTEGIYRVEIWDSEHGKKLETREADVKDGTMNIPLPELTTEVAIKILVSHKSSSR